MTLEYKIKKIDGEWQAIAFVNGKKDNDKTYFSIGGTKEHKADCIATAQKELLRAGQADCINDIEKCNTSDLLKKDIIIYDSNLYLKLFNALEWQDDKYNPNEYGVMNNCNAFESVPYDDMILWFKLKNGSELVIVDRDLKAGN